MPRLLRVPGLSGSLWIPSKNNSPRNTANQLLFDDGPEN